MKLVRRTAFEFIGVAGGGGVHWAQVRDSQGQRRTPPGRRKKIGGGVIYRGKL